RAKQNRKEGRAEPDDERVDEARYDLGWAGDHHVVGAHELLVPAICRGEARYELRRLARADGEEIDVALERRLEQQLRRIGDRIRGRLEGGRAYPQQGHDGDHRVEDDRPGSARLG